MSFALEMMVVVLEPFASAIHFHRRDDDFLDKLNHKVSTSVMFFFVFMHTFYQIFREHAIHCWTPSQFPESWIDYTNAHCWAKNTYYVPPHQTDLPDEEHRKHIVYYQWVPFMLTYLGILFYLPGLIWYVGSASSGLSVEDMVCSVRMLSVSTKTEIVDSHVRGIGCHINKALKLTRLTGDDNSKCSQLSQKLCGCYQGKSLTIIWITTKLLYLLSNGVQIYSLYLFIGYDYISYGIRRIADVFNYEISPSESTMFPKVTMCDFEIRSLAQHLPYTVQCNLPINIFNAKIFLCVWYWIALVTLLNLLIFVYEVTNLTVKYRLTYMKEALLSLDSYNSNKEKTILLQFVQRYLNWDGYLTMKYLALNANELVSACVIKELWLIFKHENQPVPLKISPQVAITTPVRQRRQKPMEDESAGASEQLPTYNLHP